jgi:SAM-dependent methyltransferase
MITLMRISDELRPYRGGYVDGVGGYKVDRPLPRLLSWRARRAGQVRRIRQIWYIKGDGDWKLGADHIGLWERLLDRLRAGRPQGDDESRRYWEQRGGEGYDQEAFSQEWMEAARTTLRAVWERLSADGVSSVLEVGCGPGRNLTLLKELGAPRLLGLDFSVPQLQRARARGFAVGQATAKGLPLLGKCVDAVLFGQVLIHVPPPIGPAIEEAVRVARRYVVLLEETDEAAGPGSASTENPHCFRHDLVGHVRRVAPQATILRLVRDVHLCTL